MNLLGRYVLRELLAPLLAWVAFLYLLLFVLQFLRGNEVLLGSAVKGWDVVRLILFLGPQFLVMALPMALLMGVLIGFGRLSEDRELVALWGMGAGPARLLGAPLMLGGVLVLSMVFLVFYAVPWGFTEVRGLINDVVKRNLTGDVKAGLFYEDLPQMTLYAEQVDARTGRWTHVLVYDDRDENTPLLVLAREGAIQTGGAKAALELQLGHGELHREDVSGREYTLIHFERGNLAMNVEGTMHQKNRFRSSTDELTPGEMLQIAEERERAEGEEGGRYLRVVYWARWGKVLMPLAFALFASPLAMGRRNRGRGQGILLAASVYTVFLISSRALEQMGNRGQLPPWAAGVLADFLLALVGGVLVWRRLRWGASA